MLLCLPDVSIPADRSKRKEQIVILLNEAKKNCPDLKTYADIESRLYIPIGTLKRVFSKRSTKQISLIVLIKLILGMQMSLDKAWALLCLNYPHLQTFLQSLLAKEGIAGLSIRLEETGLPLLPGTEDEDEEEDNF